MPATRVAIRWALPVGLVAVVMGTLALGPPVRTAAAGDTTAPSTTELLATWPAPTSTGSPGAW